MGARSGLVLSRFVAAQAKQKAFFLAGVALGLSAALLLVPLDEPSEQPCAAPRADELAPEHAQRAPRPDAARAVQRPRYYSTELGIKGRVLAGVLADAAALETRGAALNATLGALRPALRLFVGAAKPAPRAPRANVVGFTDSREMLKPFHALKYLADNFLEEYEFFFLTTDEGYVNARRLLELVGGLSAGRDVYMGEPDAGGDYCALDAGVLISNSVLRAVAQALDWCVRNSYSPRHHENLGRCVLHAARLRCQRQLQGRRYEARDLNAPGPDPADAVVARPVAEPRRLHQLHAYVARVQLERARREARRLRRGARRARLPRGYRNATWPAGLRLDAGLAPPAPDNRFDHLRWTTFNATHAFLPDEHHAVRRLAGSTLRALQMVLDAARAWAKRRWGGDGEADAEGGDLQVELEEGAWCWEPPRALRYTLLLRLRRGEGDAGSLRRVEAARALGAARLASVPYVTEGARVWLLLAAGDEAAARAFVRRYAAVCLAREDNTALVLVYTGSEAGAAERLRAQLAALSAAHRGARLELLEAAAPAASSARAALRAAAARLPRDALVLMLPAHAEYSSELLNRVRMNTILGVQWFQPLGFARHAVSAHARFVAPDGRRPATHTGRFNAAHEHAFAVYRADCDAALAAAGAESALSVPQLLARSALRCLRAPEPALVLEPRAAPCGLREQEPEHEREQEPEHVREQDRAACLRALSEDGFRTLDLGAKHSLARLLLETEADAQMA